MNRHRWNDGVLLPLGVGLAAGVLTIGYAVDNPRRAFVAWIAAYGLAFATSLGAMILLMSLHVTGARWWLVLRPVFVAAASTAPVLILLFLPIGAALSFYPAHSRPPDLPAFVEEALEHQRTWNHPAFFLLRAAFYLATWTVLALSLWRASPQKLRTERTVSAVGLPIVGFTLTFAAFDWLMALQPGWVSTMFGVYVFSSGFVAALSALAIAAWLAERSGFVPAGVAPDHVHAIGRLLLMAVIFWAYAGFFQLALLWIANLPREVAFYKARAHGTWAIVDVLLFAGRFLFPFLALLSRPLKRSAAMLAGVAAWLLFTSVLDFAWLTIPSTGAELAWADALPFVCVLSLVWAYGAHLARVATATEEHRAARAHDPAVEESLRYRSP